MRTLPSGLAGHLAGDATTLCHCWRLARRDGTVMGFTEHDSDLVFGGLTYRAASGFQASEAEAEAGFAATSGEVTGGFSDEAITEADLAAGRYDGARVEVFLVNWANVGQRLLLKVQEVGEVSRAGGAFTAELRSLTHRLSQEKGRIYNRRCDASLGDGRCGVALSAWTGTGTVSVAGTEAVTVAGLSGFAAGFFDRGLIRFVSGVLSGVKVELEATEKIGGSTIVRFFLPLARAPEPGDTVQLTAGCDKTFATCRNRFSNHENFRGFPHMPGADFAYSYADGETTHDGRPLYD
ncbi:DUF2163 domain-containing protein [Ciceribacter sp. L1K22]|uniref:DUF2163 domain-containing protein n=1 Tax=Ciceribacter sp. L1K22 TaxID=2820275 RepID=UPI001ABDCF0D|nr:DUF2163 domain-containing protein [Ciceribacter sp. L1K22]MBO3759496.1 DUF2163 domain-containing protein [Ciceribacter sp. L1K22]